MHLPPSQSVQQTVINFEQLSKLLIVKLSSRIAKLFHQLPTNIDLFDVLRQHAAVITVQPPIDLLIFVLLNTHLPLVNEVTNLGWDFRVGKVFALQVTQPFIISSYRFLVIANLVKQIFETIVRYERFAMDISIRRCSLMMSSKMAISYFCLSFHRAL